MRRAFWFWLLILTGCFKPQTVLLPTAVWQETDVVVGSRESTRMVPTAARPAMLPTESGMIAVFPFRAAEVEGAPEISELHAQTLAEAFRAGLRNELIEIEEDFPRFCEGRRPCLGVLEAADTEAGDAPLESTEGLVHLRNEYDVEWVLVGTVLAMEVGSVSVSIRALSTEDGAEHLSIHRELSSVERAAVPIAEALLPEVQREASRVTVPVTERMRAIVDVVEVPQEMRRSANAFTLRFSALYRAAPRNLTLSSELMFGIRLGDDREAHFLILGGGPAYQAAGSSGCGFSNGQEFVGGGARFVWEYRRHLNEYFYLGPEFSLGLTVTEGSVCDGLETVDLRVLEVLTAGGGAGFTFGKVNLGILARVGFGPWESSNFSSGAFGAFDSGFVTFSFGGTAGVSF